MRSAALLLVLAVAATCIPAASAATGLTIRDGRSAIYDRVELSALSFQKALGKRAAVDWNVSRCFKHKQNVVQCRWSISLKVFQTGALHRCYGNARAVARPNTIKAKLMGGVCSS